MTEVGAHSRDLVAACLPMGPSPKPLRIVPSTWIEHAPFAFWLVENHRPQIIVELGSHYGFSYFCFCQQVRQLKLPTRCFAVDTWKGDKHSGFYGDEVLEELKRYHDPIYGDFSRLTRATFDEALAEIEDGSVDLLHIDGRHEYEDVRHDFHSWQRKLSSRAIVLMHDTQVRQLDFGVLRFWQEISQGRPHFEFQHGYGLGVLGEGKDFSTIEFPLFEAGRDPAATAAIRKAYARRGSRMHSLARRLTPAWLRKMVWRIAPALVLKVKWRIRVGEAC